MVDGFKHHSYALIAKVLSTVRIFLDFQVLPPSLPPTFLPYLHIVLIEYRETEILNKKDRRRESLYPENVKNKIKF